QEENHKKNDGQTDKSKFFSHLLVTLGGGRPSVKVVIGYPVGVSSADTNNKERSHACSCCRRHIYPACSRTCQRPGPGAESDEQNRRHRPDARYPLDQRCWQNARVLSGSVQLERKGQPVPEHRTADPHELSRCNTAGRHDPAQRCVQLRTHAIWQCRTSTE